MQTHTVEKKRGKSKKKAPFWKGARNPLILGYSFFVIENGS